jgi:nucleoside-diphosphate-sugar epimerase
MRVLVTGATGALGTELMRRLRATAGVSVVGCSRRGAADRVVRWAMGAEEPAPILKGPWDVVIHAAANTRWNMSVADAERANVASTAALAHVMSPGAHLVYVSTLFADGVRGGGESADPNDYRNTYEWSKARGERMVRHAYAAVTVVRPPMIIGRRDDGHLSRFVGIYALMRAALTGLAPLIVAESQACLELVPVDDVATQVLRASLGPPPQRHARVEIGRGRAALTVRQTLTLARDAINEVRAARGIAPVDHPPLVTPDQWTRLFSPLAGKSLTERQKAVLKHLEYFIPYMSITRSFVPSVVVQELDASWPRAVRYWAVRHPYISLGTPRPWVAQRDDAR